MPRFRNLVNFASDDKRPYETVVDVSRKDSVRLITLYIEPNFYVQLSRDDKSISGWRLVSNIVDISVLKDDMRDSSVDDALRGPSIKDALTKAKNKER